jgi:two-component system, cell cycle sensor histidine kinase and response regulator CckA
MKARILVVEDESIVQLDLQTRLRRLGHSVIGVASRGEEAVAKAVDLAPDLVLMDVRLEGAMDGLEAARRIRAEREIPIIFVTAFADSTEPELIQLLRPCLSKPFATPELQAAIARALGVEPEGN